jgi:hypothetical protein
MAGQEADCGTYVSNALGQRIIYQANFSDEELPMTTSGHAGASRLLLLFALAVVATRAERATAVTFDFEAPAYSAGPLVGQDGWGKNVYYATMNGNLNVSATSPLSGAQSISYEQTVAGGLADVNRANVLLITPGVQGTDVTLSYTIKATPNSFGAPHGGMFLQQVGGSGASPIFGRINGGFFEVGAAGAVVPINDFFFGAGERIKVTYEVDFDASTMNLILENLEAGDIFSQNYPFFAGYGAPLGPNGEYQVSVAAFFRGGNVQMDDVTLTAGVGPLITDYEWTAAGSGNWNQSTNWTPAGLPGTVAGRQHVLLGDSITSNATIFNNSTRNLNSLEIDSVNSYAVAGVGSLDFQADQSGPTAVAPSINVASGAHQIQLPVNLQDDTAITVAVGASIDFNNQIDLNGHTLTTSGTVRINHSTVGGGTLLSVGALMAEGDAELGGNLISEGTLAVGIDEQGFDSFSVAGDAVLSGTLDVSWDPSSLPSGSFAVVTVGGNLDASGLTLAADDAKSFALSVEQGSLMLTFLGVAVPEPSTLGMIVYGLIGIAARRPRRVLICLAGSAMAATTLVGTSPATAAVIDFENPPYAAGDLLGQQGWVRNNYVTPAALNGDVTVSSVSPLVGGQSLLFNQTSTPPGFGASDLSKANVAFATSDGSPAIDLTATIRMQVDANASGDGQLGFFLSGNAIGGLSPIGVKLNGANSANGTGVIQVLHTTGFVDSISYAANNVVEFQFGVDFDNGGEYEIAARDVTAGQAAFTPLVGPLTGGRFGFFNAPNVFPADGDGVTYTVDVGTLLRGGAGRIDAITLVGDDFVQAEWNGGSGDWNQQTSWIPNLVPNAPAGNAQIAIFSNRFTAPQTIFTDSTQTVNGLRFDNANKHVVAGQGSIVLKANTIGGVVNPTVNVLNGAHELQVAVNVLDNTTVTVAAGAQLDFNNAVALGGKTLSTSGLVNVNYGVTGGGSIVNSGTLGTAGTTPVAANLTSMGTLQFDLGAANKDFFSVTGNATLSGLVDVVLEPGFAPTGSYTLLTTTGTLNAASLALTPADASQFTLGVVGKNLVLTVGGSSFIPGDFNKDGSVNGADLTKWKGDFGANANSDADNDGDSDGNDFLTWQRNFGQTSAAPTAAAVPEPSSLALVALSMGWCGMLWRRSKSIGAAG